MSAPNTLTPRMYNTEYINVNETNRSTVNSTIKLSDNQYEEFILYNLAKEISPTDISINRVSMPKDASLNLSNTNLRISTDVSNILVNHVLFNNDDSYIQSENFAMNIDYSNGAGSIERNSNYSIVGPSTRILSNVTLTNKTSPLYDSNLKMNFTLNNQTQVTNVDSNNKRWTADFNRNFNNMNYFAAINSHLNTNNGSYPFSVTPDLSTNILSIAGETDTIPAKYFTLGSNGQRTEVNFADTDISANTLAFNGLKMTVDPTYTNFDGSEFKTYKITQSANGLGLLIQIANNSQFINGSKLPLGKWVDGTDVQDGGSWLTYDDISKNVSSLHPENSSRIDSGFTSLLTIGNVVSGGYSANTSMFTLDDNNLTTTGTPQNLNYFTNHKARSDHYVDISNGRVYIDSSNATFISLSEDGETLDASFSSVPGRVLFNKTVPDCTGKSSDARVSFLFDLSFDKITPTGDKSSLTEKVSVYNNVAEQPAGTYANGFGLYSSLDNTLARAADVSYSVKVIVESTSNTNTVTYDELDKRNLGKNTQLTSADPENARIVIANPYKPINFNIANSTNLRLYEADTVNKIRKDNTISILNIKNKCMLVNDGSLCSLLTSNNDICYNSVVPGASCKVDLEDTEISSLKYYDYRVKLKTKTATDLSNSITRTNNNWSFATTILENDKFGLSTDVSGFLIGNPQRVSEVIYNDAQFLSGTTNVDIRYTFSVNPLATSLNTIRYDFDASLNDPTRGNNSFNYKFGGANDITFDDVIDFSDINLGTVSSNNITGSANYVPSTYIFEKWLRRRRYKAQVNPSLPFYENLLLKTENINEEVFYYRAWSKSSNGAKSYEVSSLILRQFSLSDVTLDNVQVKLVQSFGSIVSGGTNSVQRTAPTCTITLKPKDCCIFLANLQGKDLSSNVWNDLGYDSSYNTWNSTRGDIDPFIKQNGVISDYNETGERFTCDVNVVFPINNKRPDGKYIVVSSPNYYIGITNKIGSNLALSADVYTFTYAQLAANTALANYFSTSFSPYNNKFDELQSFKSSISYDCDLSLNNNTYTLKVSHINSSQSYLDAEIQFPNDYVLNFNVICSPFNLLAITKRITGSAPSVYYDNLTVENGNRIVKVDNGVYLTLVNNVTFGMEERFLLNKDIVNVQFVNNSRVGVLNDPSNGNFYRNNNAYWGDVSGRGLDAVLKYKPIVFNNPNNLTIVNTGTTNKTKSIIFNRVRGYNMTDDNNDVEITRTPAVYKFILDVSYIIPQRTDISNDLPVLVNNKVGDASNGTLVYALPVNDLSRNSPLVLYNRAASGDLSRNYVPRIIIEASSNWSVYNQYQNIIDPSFNYKFEKQIYEQTWNSGVGNFRVDNAVSTGPVSAESAATNTVDADEKVRLDIGLIVIPTRSVLSVAEQNDLGNRKVLLNVSAANYAYSLYNTGTGPNLRPILNGDGSGNLFEGIITNFMNLKTRAVKAKEPFTIKIVFTGSLIRVFTADTYTDKPSESLNWVQLPTSPFTQDQISLQGNPISLHPNILNGSWPIKLSRTVSNNNSFTSYFVCAPPAVRITYNPISNAYTSLPITNPSLETIYTDVKIRNPVFNLRTLVNNSIKVPDNVTITSPDFNLHTYRGMSASQNNSYKFIINGNNVELSLYSGTAAPEQTAITYYVDVSLNKSNVVTDVSYSFTVFTDVSNQLVTFPSPDNNSITTSTIYTGPINFIENRGNLYRVTSTNGVNYDISLCQPVTQFLQGITNNSFNINFIIDNAFIPPNVSYLPLKTTKSSTVSFYDSTCRFDNGKYYVFLNKYSLNAGTNYETLISSATNVSALSFMIDRVQQKSIQLFTDSSYIHPLINSKPNPTSLHTNKNAIFIENIKFEDLSGGWTTLPNQQYSNIGITLSAIDASGIQGIRDLLLFDITKQIDRKTLFIERRDIFRVSSAFGEPIFRITNSGNIITPKVTASILSLFQQSVTTQDLFPGLKTNTRGDDRLVLTRDEALQYGGLSHNTLDFSGNVLVTQTL